MTKMKIIKIKLKTKYINSLILRDYLMMTKLSNNNITMITNCVN